MRSRILAAGLVPLAALAIAAPAAAQTVTVGGVTTMGVLVRGTDVVDG